MKIPPSDKLCRNKRYNKYQGKFMTKKTIKPGENTGKEGGIYQEIGPRGGKKPNYATIRDNQKAPPTTEQGHKWTQIHKTPDSSK